MQSRYLSMDLDFWQIMSNAYKLGKKKKVLFMRFVIFRGYELLTELVPLVIVFAVLRKRNMRNGRPSSRRHILRVCVFSVYIIAVFYLTDTGTIFDLLRYGREMHQGQENFIPFANDNNMIGYSLNVLLFVPFGFLLAMIWPSTGEYKHVLLSGLLFSLLIEVSQLLNHRATDVDDLIMNAAGAALGFLVYRAFAHITKWDNKRLDCLKYEPFVYVGAMFLGRFLLYNQLGVAKILYGFRLAPIGH